LRALASRPGPKTHRTQVTVNGVELELRSIIGRMLYTTSPANLANACRLWLADLRLERPARVRRRVRINLERAIGVRGDDLDPALRQQIMDALTEKGMECRQ
jgi:lauroyl/myristoyl acyltransferase